MSFQINTLTNSLVTSMFIIMITMMSIIGGFRVGPHRVELASRARPVKVLERLVAKRPQDDLFGARTKVSELTPIETLGRVGGQIVLTSTHRGRHVMLLAVNIVMDCRWLIVPHDHFVVGARIVARTLQVLLMVQVVPMLRWCHTSLL